MKSTFISASLLALTLNSCIVTTNLGGLTEDLGVERSYRIGPSQERQKLRNTASPSDFNIYQLNGDYYMELYFILAQKSTSIMRAEDMFGNEGGVLILWESTKERLDGLERKPYMVKLNKEYVSQCLQIDLPEQDDNEISFIPKEDFDFTHATRCTPKLKQYRINGKLQYHELRYYIPPIPEQKGIVHYALQPISWPLKVVDAIPPAIFWGGLWLAASPQILLEHSQVPEPLPELQDNNKRRQTP